MGRSSREDVGLCVLVRLVCGGWDGSTDDAGFSICVVYCRIEPSSAFNGGLPRFLCVTSTHVAYSREYINISSGKQNIALTDFPATTHRRHGRAESHPKCFFLQFTHAEATCALVRRVGFCPTVRVAPGGDAANVAGANGCSTCCDPLCPPNTGGNRGRVSLAVNGLCDTSLVEVDTTRCKVGSRDSEDGGPEVNAGPNDSAAVVGIGCGSSGYPGRLESPAVSNVSLSGFELDIERWSCSARGLHPRSLVDRLRFNESRSGLGLKL